MILRVPVTFTDVADWARKVANAINQLAPLQDGVNAGPFADDAAAGAGNIPVGGLYRKPDGTIAWRVS